MTFARVPRRAVSIPMTPSRAPSSPRLLFGSIEFCTELLDAVPQWRWVSSEIKQEGGIYAARARTIADSRAFEAWPTLIAKQTGRPQLDQLATVNWFVKRWRCRMDQQNYGQRDWATPARCFARSGDCEDDAITNYVTLRRLASIPKSCT